MPQAAALNSLRIPYFESFIDCIYNYNFKITIILPCFSRP